MEGVPGDLQAKYQKIATEYAKVLWLCVMYTGNMNINLTLQVIICNFLYIADESTSQCIEEGCGRRTNS